MGALALDHEQLGAWNPGGQQSRVRGRDDPILVSMPDRGWLADGGEIRATAAQRRSRRPTQPSMPGVERHLNAREVRDGLVRRAPLLPAKARPGFQGSQVRRRRIYARATAL